MRIRGYASIMTCFETSWAANFQFGDKEFAGKTMRWSVRSHVNGKRLVLNQIMKSNGENRINKDVNWLLDYRDIAAISRRD